MADQDLRDRLIAYVADEPPRTLTAQSVLRAGRRARTVHRLGVASAVVVLAAGALLPTVLLRPTPGLAPGDPTPTLAGEGPLDPALRCASAAAPTPPVAVRVAAGPGDESGAPGRPDAKVDRTAARLTCSASELVAARLPRFRFAALHDALQGGRPRPTEPLEFYVEPSGRFLADAVAIDERGAITLGFEIAGSSRLPTCDPDSCTRHTGPRDEQILVLGGEAGHHIEVHTGHTVVVFWELRLDGRVRLSSPDGHPRDELPLSVDELIEVALDPRLDVFDQR